MLGELTDLAWIWVSLPTLDQTPFMVFEKWSCLQTIEEGVNNEIQNSNDGLFIITRGVLQFELLQYI